MPGAGAQPVGGQVWTARWCNWAQRSSRRPSCDENTVEETGQEGCAARRSRARYTPLALEKLTESTCRPLLMKAAEARRWPRAAWMGGGEVDRDVA